MAEASSKPWSAVELDDLQRGLRIGVSIEVIADVIERDVVEVRSTAAELGLLSQRSCLAEEAFN
jgi:hypothetical protein